MASYRLNPFCMVTDTPRGIILNGLPDLRVVFEREHRPIIDLLIAREQFQEEEILKLVAPTRLEELVAKKVLLRDGETLEQGRYSRQRGYFSLTADQPQEVVHRLSNAHVLILGVGAIGSHVLWNLAAIGVGNITVVDFDTVEESNFNRQLMYTPGDLGRLKVDVICERIRAFNPGIKLTGLNRKIGSEEDIRALLDGVDLVVKAIDTPEESNNWVNSVCVRARIPFIVGGFIDCVGVVGPNYIPGRSTCFACVGDPGTVRRLHGTGATFAPLTTIVSSKLAMVAYKILIKEDAKFADRVFTYDTRDGQWTIEDIVPAETCRVCGAEPRPSEAADPRQTPRILYRASLMALMALTVVLREFFGQDLAGTLMFLALFATMPVIYAIEDRNVAGTRRQFFVISCIYVLFGVGSLLIDDFNSGAIQVPASFDAFFTDVRSICGLVAQAVLAVTILFFGMCAVLKATPFVMAFARQGISEA
ncbi:MAG: HesA/MoeB/ThiF family protein [Alphaproteobacteria bacterium]|nr:HesA/MoeB/ThiF family protein [Alphaproteobacteria bacterium]